MGEMNAFGVQGVNVLVWKNKVAEIRIYTSLEKCAGDRALEEFGN